MQVSRTYKMELGKGNHHHPIMTFIGRPRPSIAFLIVHKVYTELILNHNKLESHADDDDQQILRSQVLQ